MENHYTTHDEAFEMYRNLYQPMPIDSPPGTEVTYWFPTHGYASDQEKMRKLGIPVGKCLTVKRIFIHSSCSEVSFHEFPGVFFNTVLFGVPKLEFQN